MRRYDRLAFAFVLAPFILTGMIAWRLIKDTFALSRREGSLTDHARWPLIAVLVGGSSVGMTVFAHLPWFTPLIAWALGTTLLAVVKIFSQRRGLLEPTTHQQTSPGWWEQVRTALLDVVQGVALLPKSFAHAAVSTSATAFKHAASARAHAAARGEAQERSVQSDFLVI